MKVNKWQILGLLAGAAGLFFGFLSDRQKDAETDEMIRLMALEKTEELSQTYLEEKFQGRA